MLTTGVLQVAMFPTLSNAASVGLVLVSTLLTFFYCLRAQPFYEAPFSTLIVLNLNLTTQSGALLFQTLSFRSIDYNLLVPEVTFGCLLAAQLATILGHLAYRKISLFRGMSTGLGTRLWAPLQLFRVPSNAELWLVGMIGLIALFFTRVVYAGNIDLGNIWGKLFQAFEFLIYAPFIIPFLDYFSATNGKPRRRSLLPLSGYFLLLVVVGIARNARITFAVALATIGICWLLGVLMGRIQIERRVFKKILLAALMGVAGMAFLTDLATAMVVVRSAREEVSYVEMVEMTVAAMSDRAALVDRQRLESSLSGYGNYSEYYTSNPLVRRLITTKFHDNMLEFISGFGAEDREVVREATRDRFLSIIPLPVIRRMNLRVPKEEIGYSMGDLLHALGTGESMINNFIVGSYLAHGIAMFSWWFFPVLVLGVCGMSIVLESFVARIRGYPVVSAFALLQIYALSGSFAGDDLGNQAAFLARILWQQVLIYLVVLTIARFLTPHSSNSSPVDTGYPRPGSPEAFSRLHGSRR